MHYYEGDRVMDIQAELGMSSIGIWSKSIRKWNPPHELDVIDDTKRDAIISNIRKAYEWAGEKLHVVDRIG